MERDIIKVRNNLIDRRRWSSVPSSVLNPCREPESLIDLPRETFCEQGLDQDILIVE